MATTSSDAHTEPPSRMDRLEAVLARRSRVVLLVAVLVAAGSVLFGAARYGLGMNTDSVGYLATADNLVAGEGLTWWNDPDFVVWPPLLPVVLAVGTWVTPWTGQDVALLLDAALVAVIVLETAVLLRSTVARSVLRSLGVAAVAVAPAVLVVARMLWSETLFVAVLLAVLLALQRACEDERLRWVLLAGVLVWAAFMTRYLGATLLVTGVLTLAILPPDRPRRARLVAAGTFAATGVAVPVLWLARNRAVSGTFAGPRPSTDESLVEILGDVLRTLGQFVLWVPSGPLRLALGVVAAIVVVALVVGSVRLARQDGRGWLAGTGGRLLPLLLFVVIYLAALVLSRSLVGFTDLGPRLLAPIFVPLVVIGLALLDEVLDRPAPDRANRFGAVAAGLTAWVVALAVSSAAVAALQFSRGDRFASRDYEQVPFDEVAADLDELECRLFSNEPAALFLWTDVESELSPRRSARWSTQPVEDLARFERLARRQPVCLVWIDLDAEERLLRPAELDQVVRLRELDRYGDDAEVVVYRVDG